jgi:hypothetical protein
MAGGKMKGGKGGKSKAVTNKARHAHSPTPSAPNRG